jgi:hypothetical protein
MTNFVEFFNPRISIIKKNLLKWSQMGFFLGSILSYNKKIGFFFLPQKREKLVEFCIRRENFQ